MYFKIFFSSNDFTQSQKFSLIFTHLRICFYHMQLMIIHGGTHENLSQKTRNHTYTMGNQHLFISVYAIVYTYKQSTKIYVSPICQVPVT